MTGLSDRARGGTVRCVVVDIQRCDKCLARDRCQPVIAMAFSIAALPALISSGVGGVQIGCHHVMAIPHCAMAQVGSLLGYVGENSPRLFIKERVQQRDAADEFRLAPSGAHDTGKSTVPAARKSPGSGTTEVSAPKAVRPADQNGEKGAPRKNVRILM